MSESVKTLAFLAIAAVTIGLSFVAKPKSAVYDVSDEIGKMLTDAFEPEAAKRLTIVKFDEETATLREFEVAEQNGVWAIPSKGGYPADAFRQMAEATTGVTDREILSIASDNAADHVKFGVVDPRSPKLEVGQTGVGLRVTMADENNDPLADLVVGKEVKDEPDQRYVRRQSQDVVYIVKIDPDKFSTDFEDWIEDDLLKINPSDILQVQINDYSFKLDIQGRNLVPQWSPRGEYTLSYDNSESKWVADELRVYDREKEDYTDSPLKDSEALDDDVLRDLRSALDDLRIVDVESKPAGLSASLKVDENFLENTDRKGGSSLLTRGFAPSQNKEGELEILSSEGEVLVTMKDGVEYVLRFGDVESRGEGAEAESQADGASDEDAESVNRYMFVVARFNDTVIEKPELEDLPEVTESASDSSGKDTPEANSEEPASDGADAAPAEPEAEEADAETQENEAAEQTADDAEQKESPEDAERKAIERRNRQKQEAYEDAITAGKKRVDVLNERFGDWYYVVANSVYSKIRLGRDDFVKQDENAGGEADAAKDASVLGAPGAPVPGLPEIGGLQVQPATEASDEAASPEASAEVATSSEG